MEVLHILNSMDIEPLIVFPYDEAEAVDVVRKVGALSRFFELGNEPYGSWAANITAEEYASIYNCVIPACQNVNPDAIYLECPNQS